MNTVLEHWDHIEIKLKTELSLEKPATMEFLSCGPDFIVIFKSNNLEVPVGLLAVALNVHLLSIEK